ncbi:MAG: 16S rRNA (cytosine(1402)-N(4))-methyltransferase RsmH [Flavobacteriales bacterium]|nr:16S rRNA (cytosine(1402)-N(4))-methyltransferase RsmH [Flavobacteriales bacterium]MCW8913843.1 16S rRNA (cytosine(1402)-N(4))-methyltransferase RsmH [Flavobacteriales bacterium]MCW8937959.1 16S rRNA (cytosine(1402)-N(4))-methyltransferase RsmH [Flavobacteriales bacterium]MCW8968256.1 16S rRNA (cytosine(1402)-N(4))-methyltransferase RsmH [Flavobacteriales bacterium]MCW8989662.1 16S rRNA (cytosine(1402)-N(4))-methyltransferase RsmH [Flavobacteriales bacterium]
MTNYHDPVLLKASVDGLNLKGDDVVVDVTFGGGGHSREIIKKLSDKGKLYGFDQDEDAVKNNLEDERFVLVRHNFRYLKNYLKMYGAIPVDAVLADLGVSSHQFDEGERGFSIRFDGPLDMRMNVNAKLTAKQVVNEYDEENLLRIFRAYGEIKNAWKLVQEIIKARTLAEINTTQELCDVAQACVPGKMRNKYLAQVFQALRIEVNDEMGALRSLLEQCYEVIKPGGRLVVITYHSLEDRMVKNFIKNGKIDGELEKDFYGNPLLKFKAVNRKPIVATEEELQQNNRARSAKLRIAERC